MINDLWSIVQSYVPETLEYFEKKIGKKYITAWGDVNDDDSDYDNDIPGKEYNRLSYIRAISVTHVFNNLKYMQELASLNKNYNVSSLNYSLGNFYYYDLPFLLSIKSDAGRYL